VRRTVTARVISSVAAGCFVAGCSGAGASAHWLDGRPAAVVLAQIVRAEGSAGSVRYRLLTLAARGAVGVTVGDVAAGQGRQQISDANGGRATRLLVGGAAYFYGNLAGLLASGMVARDVRRFANQWVLVPATAPAFHVVADQLTLRSLLAYITPTQVTGVVHLATLDGHRLYAINGGASQAVTTDGTPGRSVLYLSLRPPYLPVAFVFTPEDSSVSTKWQLSGWGETVTVNPPPRRHART
jgi:hypothetical protein